MEYYNSLLKNCIQILEEYQGTEQSVDIYLDNFFATKRLDDNDRNFVEEIFSGVTRYKKFNKILLDAYYKQSGAMPLITDMKLYSILSYLFFIRLEELTWPEFENFVMSQSALRMKPFFEFLGNRKNLEALKDQWLEFYDLRFIDGQVLAQVDHYQEMFPEFVSRLQRKSEGSTSRRSEKKETTVPQPFQLTPAKPKPQQEFVLKKIEALPVPKEKYGEHEKLMKKLEKKKEENKRLLEEKFKNFQPPQFQERPIKEKEAKEDESEKFEAYKANPVPIHILAPTEELNGIVSGNKTALLRQEAYFRRKQEKIEQTMKNYEIERRDAGDFITWQQEMKEREEQEKAVIIQMRKMEQKMIRETLAEAKDKIVDENKQVAVALKEELKVIEKSKEKEKLQREKEKKAVVEEVRLLKGKVEQAKTGVVKKRQETVVEMQKQLQEKRQQMEEDQRQEKLQKEDLIRQIRAIEKIPRPKSKFFNPSEVSGPGYFSDMSLTELKEKLSLLQEKQQKNIEEKREQILKKKRDQEEALKQKAENILAIRRQMEEDSLRKREERKRQVEEKAQRDQEMREKAMLELHDKMEKKRADRLNNLHKLSEDKMRNTQKLDAISGGKSVLEERKFKDLELAEERAAKERQEEQRRIAESILETKEKEDATRKQIAMQKLQEKEAKERTGSKPSSPLVKTAEKKSNVRSSQSQSSPGRLKKVDSQKVENPPVITQTA